MDEIRDCINCENYRYWLEIQLVDDAGQPLDNQPFTLKERGTDKSVSGVTDGQGLFRAEELSARPLMLITDAQSLVDKLTADNPGRPLQYPEESLKSWCRAQGYILSEDNNAGAFSTVLPGNIYDMSPAQISRLRDYVTRHDGYPLTWPYNHRRVITIRRLTEKVYAKSVLRGTGNTDAGTETERLDNFGQYQTPLLQPEKRVAQAGFFLPLPPPPWGPGAAGSAYKPLPGLQKTQHDDDFFSHGSNTSHSVMSSGAQRKFILALLNTALFVGIFIAKNHDDDSLTYEDLAEKAKDSGTATTRVRIKYQENTATGEQAVVSYATKGSNDQVRVRMGVKAPEYEAEEIRTSSQTYHSDGLPTPQSLATIYKFELDDGNILYLGVDTDNKFVELTSSTHPDEFGGRGWHTGGEIDKIDVPADTGNHNPYLPGRTDSSGGFQAHNNGPVILTNPVPDEQGFNDYILITPIADIPAIYVYLSEGDDNKLLKEDRFRRHHSTSAIYTKHTKARSVEDAIIFSSEGKPAQYWDVNIKNQRVTGDVITKFRNETEKEALKNGRYLPQKGGTDYYIYNSGRIIGYNDGKPTSFIRVEVTSSTNEFHGHPISDQDYSGYLKRIKND